MYNFDFFPKIQLAELKTTNVLIHHKFIYDFEMTSNCWWGSTNEIFTLIKYIQNFTPIVSIISEIPSLI